MVRAKFHVTEITRFAGSGGASVKLRPVYSDGSGENAKFWNATPSGEIQMHIKSEAIDLFELGEEYYVDFTSAKALTPEIKA